MTKTTAYTMTALIPNEHTGSRTPFVSPVFADAFRKVERLCWEGKALAYDVRASALADWSEKEVEPGIHFLEQWLKLQLLNAELTEASKDLESKMQQLSSPLDPRHNNRQNADAQDCMEQWLLDGRRINLLKGRGLLQVTPKLQKTFVSALEDTKEEAQQVRATLSRLAQTALFSETSYSLESELLEVA